MYFLFKLFLQTVLLICGLHRETSIISGRTHCTTVNIINMINTAQELMVYFITDSNRLKFCKINRIIL